MPDHKQNDTLQPFLSPAAAWALAVGTSVGWGSLVVTSNTYLAQAGPAGSILGLLIGMALMLVICRNFFFMASRYPRAGGIYEYTKEVFGYDRAFLVFWFLSLTYISMFWANATSLPLFARFFIGDVFKCGYLFSVFGYEIYLGEAILTLFAICAITFLCIRSRITAAHIMVALAAIFTIGISVCFAVAAMARTGSWAPAFVPEKSALSQTLRIAFISPWAFIGFENITHFAEEFSFKKDKLHRILVGSVLTSTAIYIFVTLLSISAYPAGCDSWLDYIRNLDSYSGLEGLPAFYAAQHYMGSLGVAILMASLLALVLTSLIGNLWALSRLLCATARDGILPDRFAQLNGKHIPANAMLLVAGISCVIPFVGRTAIGWIVDVTTLGATMLYAFVSAATLKTARKLKKRRETVTGFAGFIVMLVFGIYLLFPNLFGDAMLATETYILFMVWTIIGFFYFRQIIKKDQTRRFGKAIVVWIALLSLVMFMAMIWSGRVDEKATNEAIYAVRDYYVSNADEEVPALEESSFIQDQLDQVHRTNTVNTVLITGLFILALGAMLINHLSMKKWETKAVEERDAARETAFKDPMTGAKSKRAYLIREKELDQAIASGTTLNFAVVVCDVNGLKKINDTLGHKAGDEYIKKAFGIVCDIFQHSPVYRIGGDEFVVILTDRDYLIRRELVLALHDRSVAHIASGGVVVSGGLSDYRPGEDESYHAVFERADELMYNEKKLLKGLGAATRDDAEENKVVIPNLDDSEVIHIKRHILIVEDEEINRIILGNMLADSYDLLYAADGVEALEQIKVCKDRLGMVMLDLQMPKMNGMEVLKVMMAEDELKDIPVIVLTADQSAEVDCLKLGAMDFIPKPYPSREIVFARINRCIELSEKRNIIHSTERDSLTNLLNLDYFLRYVRLYDQHYPDMPMDAVVVDINHFHMINERYGKQYGDSVLGRIGERIRKVSRDLGGVACRRGADTFFIYCPRRSDYEDILEKLSEGLTGEGNASSNRVRLRMGVYANADKSLEIERRFEYARTAANTVKTGYAKAIGFYDAKMHQANLLRERLLEDFRPSLRAGWFSVYFQPKFDIRPDKPLLSSAEALVRWNHPELGMISPAVFIPLLEDNGLILELDEFVWRTAAAQIRDWKDRFGFSIPISVNVSRIDMLMPNLKSIFRDILESYRIESKDLLLEITESAYTGDSEQMVQMARELSGAEMGFRIEMDDFGTGYSSLSMLTNLPIDVLKLDMSFVKSAFGEKRDMRMIELIIQIAEHLNIPVIAEGVETEEQYLTLRELGCDFVQGYYFSRPIPAGEFEHFMTECADEQKKQDALST